MFEVEVKSIPTKNIIKQIQDHPESILVGSSKQLNHYFSGILHLDVLDVLSPVTARSERDNLKTLLTDPSLTKLSVRTRYDDSENTPNDSQLIIKASINDTSSENGTIRREEQITVYLSIQALDLILQENGLTVQSKWRRSRETYLYKDVTICVDFDAGYGDVVEVEKLVSTKEATAQARKRCLEILTEFGLTELDQDHLENNMFPAYSADWNKFYSTNTTFLDYPEYAHLLQF